MMPTSPGPVVLEEEEEEKEEKEEDAEEAAEDEDGSNQLFTNSGVGLS